MMPELELRPYQSRALEAAKAALEKGSRNWLVTWPTGAGKTILLVRLARHCGIEGSVLVLAHRDSLVDQTRLQWLRAHPGDRVGIEMGTLRVYGEPYECIVSSVQTLKGERLQQFVSRYREKIGLLIVDECFPAGTLIDDKPIETICEGDFVQSFNHKTGQIEQRQVKQLFKSKAHTLVRVILQSGQSIVCTAGHPFWNGSEYVPAAILRNGHIVYSNYESKSMRRMQHEICTPIMEQHHDSDLFAYLQAGSQRGPDDQSNTALCRVWNDGAVCWQDRIGVSTQGTSVLLTQLHKGMEEKTFVTDDESDEYQICLQKNAGSQSYVRSCQYHKDGQGDAGQNVPFTRRKWQNDNATEETSRGIGTVNGIRHNDCNSESELRISAKSLQGGYSRSTSKTSDRSGRENTPTKTLEVSRPTQDGSLAGIRVERVEVLERAGGYGFGDVCPDGYVYNIEVEGNHNYFVDGLLVHNCHHVTAPTYQAILSAFQALPEQMTETSPTTLGVTATMLRLDGEDILKSFPNHIDDYPIVDAMRDGYLCRVKASRIVTSVDLRQVKSGGGDFVQKQLAEAVDVSKRIDIITKKWKILGGMKKRTADFCVSKEQCRHHAEAYRALGAHVQVITEEVRGEERKQALEAFAWGPLPQVAISVDVLTEGTDIPQMDMIINSAPTKSSGRFLQRVGRGLRLFPAPGIKMTPDGRIENPCFGRAGWDHLKPKSHLILLDVVDTVKRQNEIITAPRILDLPATFDLEGQDVLECRDTLDEILERDPELTAAVAHMVQSEEKVPTNFADLRAHLERIMLFAPLNIRGLAAQYSNLAWLASDPEAFLKDDSVNAKNYTLFVPIPKEAQPFEVEGRWVYRLDWKESQQLWLFVVERPTAARAALEREVQNHMMLLDQKGLPGWFIGQQNAKIRTLKAQAEAIPLEKVNQFLGHSTLKETFREVDPFLWKRHPSARGIVDVNARWRKERPTTGQLNLCKKKNIPVHSKMNRGDLSDLINNFENFGRK